MGDLVSIFNLERYRITRRPNEYDPAKELKRALRTKKKRTALEEKWEKKLKEAFEEGER